MDLVFLLSHIPNPRMNKRISVAKGHFTTCVICWDRKITHIWNIYHSDVQHVVLELPLDKKKCFNRLKQTLTFARRASKQLNMLHPKCIYAGNIDMLLIAYLYSFSRKCHIIYEVADLNKMFVEPQSGVKNIIKHALMRLERHICRKVNYLILTSEQFYDVYYKNLINKERVLVIPNIPNLDAFKNYKRKISGSFTVGFIGGIRYVEQLINLVEAAQICNIKVLISGSSFDLNEEQKIRNYCEGKSYVRFTGQYDYNKTVADLYGQCDCIYSVYDADSFNVRVAIPNRFYETIYCQLPIVVAKQTYLANLVENMQIGVAVNHKDTNELTEVLKKMSTDQTYYNGFIEQCKKWQYIINLDKYDESLKLIFSKLCS